MDRQNSTGIPDERTVSAEDPSHARLALVTGFIYLTLGVTFSGFAISNWGISQHLTLLSGLCGIYLGVRSLVNFLNHAAE